METPLSKIRDFLQGNLYKFLDENTSLLPLHIKEQAAYRASLCNECLVNGKCVICKCSTPAMFFSPEKVDSKNRWGAMVGENEWKLMKETFSKESSPLSMEIPDIDILSLEEAIIYPENLV